MEFVVIGFSAAVEYGTLIQDRMDGQTRGHQTA
jgi:hypothetical protein